MNVIARYMRWLHTQWPAGTVEKLPLVRGDYSTNVTGLYITGDLTGVPLLKFSADSGAKVIHTIVRDGGFVNRDQSDDGVLDVAIVGGGVSGFAAAIEASKVGLRYRLFEAAEPFSTIVNFPKRKPIYTYPTDMKPAGQLQFHDKSDVKEGLLDDLHEQVKAANVEPTILRIERVKRRGKVFELAAGGGGEPIRAHRVIVAIGRSGNFRKLGVSGEQLDKVYNRLHDPADFCDQKVAVIGGGDSAMETAIALATCGCDVTLSYRKVEFARPKPENIDKIRQLAADGDADVSVEEPTGDRVTTAAGRYQGDARRAGKLRLMMASKVKAIGDDTIVITNAEGVDKTLENKAVFSMIGREPPLEFFRRSGVKVVGDRGARWWASLVLMLMTFTFLYHVKKPGTWLPIAEWWQGRGWFPYNLPGWLGSLSSAFNDPANLLGTAKLSVGSPGFWFSVMYTVLIVTFGVRRIRRRRTPYVMKQTVSLMAFQVVPLFLLPYFVLPWLGHLGLFDGGVLKTVADGLFPSVSYDPHGREYWRAFGFVLAWPLFLWNVFSDQPLGWWLAISLVQTFVIIPLLVWRWGKGAYCGWICSCGAMAETLGDTHRHKMPHGPRWNRLNMVGQVFLVFAFGLLALRVVGWVWPTSFVGAWYKGLLSTYKYGGFLPGLNYAWFVDLLWAGILGFGLYFHFSGRVWCRFACPLAALMHIYARFSRFRILTEKKKCISCNVCTSVCHQGIDVMNFANKGLAMSDPQCVRCSACVQSCPTGVLSFGQVDRSSGEVVGRDRLAASPVQMAELTVDGRAVV